MKIFSIILLLSTTALYAQDIACPDDVIVHLFDLDSDYETYGDPQVSGPDVYDISRTITIIDNSCQGLYGQNANIEYTISDQSTGTALDQCIQSISITRPVFADWTFPADYNTSQSTLEDLEPSTTGYIEPSDILINGDTNFAHSYEDIVIPSGDGVRILRTWTLLDWCTADFIEEVQIINAQELSSVGSGTSSVSSCDNRDIEVDNIKVLTDVTGYTVDYGNCATTTSDLLSFVNCVADNNSIPTDNNFIIEIEKGDPLNGVSTLDMVLVQRHILGRAPFNDQCSIIAADVNDDGRISALDMVETRKLILGIYNELPQSPSWKFFNAEFFGPNTLDRAKDLKFAKAEFPLTSLEIIGVKVGDVNGTHR